jgi:5-methylcytosine-specific restriction endonuclease McrA
MNRIVKRPPYKIWLWSVTKENWEILRKKKVWASSNKGKIRSIIRPRDKIIFYVKGTKELRGIFTIISDWYDVKKPTWYKEKKSTRFPSQVKIKEEIVGNVRLDVLIGRLTIFKTKKLPKSGKFTWDQSMILKPRSGGYPSNNGESMSHKDYQIILKELQNDISNKIKKERLKRVRIPIDKDGAPGRKIGKTIRYIRDTQKSRKLKKKYRHRCQVCNYRLEISRGKYYSEVHHIFPLKKGGPDNYQNMVVLCARCHAEFDYQVIGISIDGLSVINRKGKKIGKLLIHKDHRLDRSCLAYQLEGIHSISK